MDKNKLMKDVFQKIIDICEQNRDKDTEWTLNKIIIESKNRIIRYDWFEKYGIELDSDCRLAEWDYYSLDTYQGIYYYKDGYLSTKEGHSRSISCSEDGKQPVDEWLYQISTSAYIFGKDYDGQKELFKDFFEELRTYKPDYEDLHNNELYWKIENAKEIMSQIETILNKYQDKNKDELKTRRINQLKNELEELTG